LAEEYSHFRPQACLLGYKSPEEENYSKKIRQIGEIQYVPKYENEDARHLKKLPNTVITE
jgi:F-box/leucine-rich repeat protein 2/20